MKEIAKRVTAGAAMGGALLFTAGMGVASAQPPVVVQDGLVNLALGDITILEDVDVAVVANVLANVCPNVAVDDINVLAESVDLNSGTQQVAECTAFTLPVNIEQNDPGPAQGPDTAPGQTGTAPGQNR
jgi:hypothetical protein